MPGTVTAGQPSRGMPPMRRSVSASASAGVRPEELSPCSRPSAQMSAKASPPRPLDVGSVTVSAAAAAIAASTALPPRRSISSPASAARGWLEQAAPRLARTQLRREG